MQLDAFENSKIVRRFVWFNLSGVYLYPYVTGGGVITSGPGCLSLCPYPAACHFVQGVQCLTSHKTLRVYEIILCVFAFFLPLTHLFVCVYRAKSHFR